MNLPDAYMRLREYFGSHGAAAKYLGMTGQHYTALRNGRANMPAWRADYIILKAQDLPTNVPSLPSDAASGASGLSVTTTLLEQGPRNLAEDAKNRPCPQAAAAGSEQTDWAVPFKTRQVVNAEEISFLLGRFEGA